MYIKEIDAHVVATRDYVPLSMALHYHFELLDNIQVVWDFDKDYYFLVKKKIQTHRYDYDYIESLYDFNNHNTRIDKQIDEHINLMKIAPF